MPYPLVPLFAPRIRVIDSATEPLRLSPAMVDDGPPPVPGGRPRGCKRLHTNATVAAVRHLIEQTTLTYKQIGARTGVSAATVGCGRAAAAGSGIRLRRAPRTPYRPPAPAAG